jgi:hypothetical protein
MNEQEQFLKELEQDAQQEDPFGQPEPVVDATPDDDDPENQPESIKDRRHRRLEVKLQSEREANIALAARLEAVAEARRESNSEESDYLKKVERIYGTDTAEAITATDLLKQAIQGAKEDAKREALEEMRAERAQEQKEVQKESEALDTMLEELEDQYGVDLTSKRSEATRTAFFTRLQKLSPKDSDGNVIAYADHHAVWEDLQARSKKTENRAKDVVSRGMTQSGSSVDSNLKDDATERFLRENGII